MLATIVRNRHVSTFHNVVVVSQNIASGALRAPKLKSPMAAQTRVPCKTCATAASCCN